MLKGFEEQTTELTEYELKNIVPILIQGFYTKIGKEKAVTNSFICENVNQNFALKQPLTEPRVRKCINYIRTKNLIPFLIATSKGYYVATTRQELIDWRDSIQGRINSIQEVLNYAQKQVDNWGQPKQVTQQKLF